MSKTSHIVPFYANTPDDTHCFQAALKMALKYFLPQKDFSWQELDDITAKHPDLWTWPMAGLLWLQNNSFSVRNIESFDYERFIREGGEYLIAKYGKEVAGEQIVHSNLPAEIDMAKQFTKLVSTENRPATIQEIAELLQQDYLVIANLNAQALNHKSGYVGHFVVITAADDMGLTLHDPGLPPTKDRVVTIEQFVDAWAYPDDSARNLMAIRPNKHD